ncbi:MAG: prolipoprotein diacylglyceryl transferase [Planctomycetia bacterium]|nr:MAG: prolipoprotein diacylglyceryl transferase [Planctomycetia bacterium]
MMPVVFRIPGINWDVPGYGLMLMIAFLAAIHWAARRASRSGGNPDVILNCGFVALISGVVGGRMFYVLHNWEQFGGRGGVLDVAWGILDVTRGGLEYYGGFLAATVCISLWLLLVERVSWRWYMDIAAPSGAVGLAFGRVGCLLNGCCFGAPTALPVGMTFPFGSPAQIQYWEEAAPGNEVPLELLYATPRSYKLDGVPFELPGLMANAAIGIPISRESLAAPDAAIAAAEERERVARAGLRKAQADLAAADTPESRAALQKARRELAAAAEKFADIRRPMREHGLAAPVLKEMAARHRSVPVHPTQAYSVVMAFIVAGLLSALYWRRTRDGQVLCALFILEPTSRFVLEMIRTDNPIDMFGIFTISQFLSLCMVAAALVALALLRLLPPRSPRASQWSPPPPAAEPRIAKA